MPFDLSHGTVLHLTAQYIVRVPIAPTYLRVSVLWRYRRRLEPQPIMSDNVLAFVGSHFDHSKEHSGSHLEAEVHRGPPSSIQVKVDSVHQGPSVGKGTHDVRDDPPQIS